MSLLFFCCCMQYIIVPINFFFISRSPIRALAARGHNERALSIVCETIGKYLPKTAPCSMHCTALLCFSSFRCYRFRRRFLFAPSSFCRSLVVLILFFCIFLPSLLRSRSILFHEKIYEIFLMSESLPYSCDTQKFLPTFAVVVSFRHLRVYDGTFDNS